MALTERQEIDLIEVVANGSLQIRTATVIERDGVEISRSFHRHVKHPGGDVSGESQRVQDIAGAVWTAQVIADYEANQAED